VARKDTVFSALVLRGVHPGQSGCHPSEQLRAGSMSHIRFNHNLLFHKTQGEQPGTSIPNSSPGGSEFEQAVVKERSTPSDPRSVLLGCGCGGRETLQYTGQRDQMDGF